LEDGLRAAFPRRAGGFPSVEEYVEALVRAELESQDVDYGAPAHLHVDSQEYLEALLLQRLESNEPGIDAIPEFWEQFKARIAQRGDARGERGPD
jgi:hypothetical protein